MGIEGYYEDYFDDRQEKEKLTNFQKIKAMSLDEMAKWLGANTCNYCIYQKVDCDNIKYCKDGIKQWLQEENE